jgi:cobalt/nickel transport system permease protein
MSAGREKLAAAFRDARIPIAVCVGFVVAVVATPLGAWHWYCIEAWLLALVAGLTRLSAASLFRRGALIWLVSLVLAMMIALTHPARASLTWPAVAASIAIKSALALTSTLILSGALPHWRLIDGLRRMGIPTVLTNTLHFMSRYLHILEDERNRMLLARRSRTFRTRWFDWRRPAGLLGTLLIRAIERGERVHAAMLARGWDGTFHPLDGDAGGSS